MSTKSYEIVMENADKLCKLNSILTSSKAPEQVEMEKFELSAIRKRIRSSLSTKPSPTPRPFNDIAKLLSQRFEGSTTTTGQQFAAAQILARRFTNTDDAIHHCQRDTCTRCGSTMIIDRNISVQICPSRDCGAIYSVLFCVSDVTSDISIVGSSLIVAAHHIQKLPVAQTIQEDLPMRIYERSPLYRRFLNQFSVKATPIPEDIFSCIYNHLASIHMHTTYRAKPTPISVILRKNGHGLWAGHALRITMMFNGETVPVLEETLIDRLVKRFSIICKVAEVTPNARAPNSDFITANLLALELRPDLANLFRNHRTRSVLIEADRRLQNLLPNIIKLSPEEFLWSHFRRSC
jgi:hypothetical protein